MEEKAVWQGSPTDRIVNKKQGVNVFEWRFAAWSKEVAVRRSTTTEGSPICSILTKLIMADAVQSGSID
jgi:hypothetical protein